MGKPSYAQTPLEGFPFIPTHDMQPPTKGPTMGEDNAAVRILFPTFFGLDTDEVANGEQWAFTKDVTPPGIETALRNGPLTNRLRTGYKAGPLVLFGKQEFRAILNVPEAFYEHAESGYHGTLKAQSLSIEERRIEAARAGAHAVEGRMPDMEGLMQGYVALLAQVEIIQKRLPRHFAAIEEGADLLIAAMAARSAFHGVVDTIAGVREWVPERIERAHAGMDWRLLGGRGEERMKAKKGYWLNMARVLVDYTTMRGEVVDDRLERSRAIKRDMPEKVR